MNYCLVLLHSCHPGTFFISLLDHFHCSLCSHIYFIRFSSLFARDPQVVCPYMCENVFILPSHLIDHLDVRV